MDRTPERITCEHCEGTGEQRRPSYCPIHQHHKWCAHNGGILLSSVGWAAPDCPHCDGFGYLYADG